MGNAGNRSASMDYEQHAVFFKTEVANVCVLTLISAYPKLEAFWGVK